MYLDSSSNMDRSKILNTHPYLRQTLDLISDKWVTAIVYVLSHGTKRHGELQREIGDVSQRMLTRTLRDLEHDGIVKREVYPTKTYHRRVFADTVGRDVSRTTADALSVVARPFPSGRSC